MADFQRGVTEFSDETLARPWWESACVALAGGVAEAWYVDSAELFAPTAEYERQRALRLVRLGLHSKVPPRGLASRIVDCLTGALGVWLREPTTEAIVRLVGKSLRTSRSLDRDAISRIAAGLLHQPDVDRCVALSGDSPELKSG
jgi:hypothetical protein